MKRGGYQILDMSDFPITTSTGYRIKNLYDSIVESSGKAFLLAGINYNGEDIGDRFVTFVLSNNIYYGLLSVSNNGIAMFVKVEPDDDVSIITKTLGGGGGSNVTITPTLESGTEVATITVDDNEYKLYGPTPQTVAVTSVLQSGTQIATITIDQTTYTLYAPEGGGGGASYGSIEGSITTGVNGSITFISEVLNQSNFTDKPYFIYSIGIPNIRFFIPVLPIISTSELSYDFGTIKVLYRDANDGVEFKDYNVYVDSFRTFGTGYQLQLDLEPISMFDNAKLYKNSINNFDGSFNPATISIDTSGTDPRITIHTDALDASDIETTTFIQYSVDEQSTQGELVKRTDANLVVTPAFREEIVSGDSKKYKYHGKVFGYIRIMDPSSSPNNTYYSGLEYDEMTNAEASFGTIIVKATDVHSM